MSFSIRQQIQAHLSDPKQFEAFLADVRRGAVLRPSDLDILQALRSLSVPGCRMDTVSVPVLSDGVASRFGPERVKDPIGEAIRNAAIANATARITRRRVAARRQRQRRGA